jgi:hypothetical protein
MKSRDKAADGLMPMKPAAQLGHPLGREFAILLKHFWPRTILNNGKPLARFATRILTLELSELLQKFQVAKLHLADFEVHRFDRLLRFLRTPNKPIEETVATAFKAGQLLTLIRLREGEAVDQLYRQLVNKKKRQTNARRRNEARKKEKEKARMEFAAMLEHDPSLTKDEVSAELARKYHVERETMGKWLVGVKKRRKIATHNTGLHS